ncbi:enoyl-CoA hydratase/isomerase family protein [Mycobacterium tilburgii]|uniref:enoyl-CoA hydratase/isomerase family protein n=1 Tax=Mycobacterium tilburgii TaxID=44467 RepID=UPI0021B4A312|nr:enoyl-CoA hydratase/isomerase family protein [Mycobacterium tilburgii]
MSIDYALNAHIATITINRPETRNSLDMEYFRDLAHAWAELCDDDGAWVAVVTGVGRDFGTSADLKKFIPELTGELPKSEGWGALDAIHAVLHRFPVYKPIIAAVNGTCAAGSFEQLGCTDIRVTVPEARFAEARSVRRRRKYGAAAAPDSLRPRDGVAQPGGSGAAVDRYRL